MLKIIMMKMMSSNRERKKEQNSTFIESIISDSDITQVLLQSLQKESNVLIVCDRTLEQGSKCLP